MTSSKHWHQLVHEQCIGCHWSRTRQIYLKSTEEGCSKCQEVVCSHFPQRILFETLLVYEALLSMMQWCSEAAASAVCLQLSPHLVVPSTENILHLQK